MAAASYTSPSAAPSYGPAGGSFGPSAPGPSFAPPPGQPISPGGPIFPPGPVPSTGPNVSFAPEKPPMPGRTPSVTFAAQSYNDGRPASLTPQPPTKHGIDESKSIAESALREYMSLQKLRYRTEEVGIEERLRVQAAHCLDDLRSLRREVADIVKTAETHRFRRWLTGSIAISFIPAIRAIFRKPTDEKESANDTEYAFRKSRSLIARIRRLVQGSGRWAGVAFFVFAVLYVFTNEVLLRVARTVGKRLKRLAAKIENGEDDIDERDMKLLSGWRWRVLLWRQ